MKRRKQAVHAQPRQQRVVVQLANGEEVVPVTSSGRTHYGMVSEDHLASEQIVEELNAD